MLIVRFFEKVVRFYIKRADQKNNQQLISAIQNLPVQTSLTLIDRIVELMGIERAKDFNNFLKAIESSKRKEKKIIKMNALASKLIRFYGNEYKVHVIY